MERGRKRGRPRTAALVAAVVLVTTSQGAAVAAPAAYPAATAPGAGTAATAARSAPAGPVAPAPGPGFASSFEEGDPQPDWTDTAEAVPAEAVPAEAVPAGRGRRKDGGRKKASGTDGTVAFGIPGNVTDEVTAVRASAQNAAAGEVKEALFDGNVSSRWQVFARTGWIEFDLARPVGPVRYALTAAGDTAGRDPRDWTLRGSDDAKTWTTLDTRTGERFSKRLETKEYALGEGTAHRSHRPYRHYRFEITGNAGASRLQLAELHLSDGDTTPPPPSDMRSGVSRGPTWSPTDSANVGFTGRKALYYGGTHRPRGRAYSYNKVFDVDVPVTPSTTLSYVIFPSMSGSEPEYPATHASLDLAFTDGTYLSDLGAADQHGARLTPSGQAASGTLYPNQWNRKESRIGAVAAGRTVDRVLVAYDAPRGPAVFRGWVDDVRIGPGAAGKRVERPSDHVLTTRGTRSSGRYSRGNTFPATAVPHGFNFWSPMTNAGSTSWLYDYARGTDEDNLPRLQAFTASHEPSPWMGDRQTFQVMPSAAPGVPDAGRTARALPFRHENETARAHYYSVAFENGLRTEIAPTDHAALMRFTFPGDAASVLFDNVGRASGLALDPDNGIVTGWSDVRSARSAGATRMFVYGVFDAPVTAGGALPGGGAGDATGWFRFDAGADRTVNLRIATSLIGTDQARSNLEQEIAASDTLGSVRERAQRAWDRVLGVIEVEGASGDRLTTLYSNLYRLHLYPNSGFEAVTGTGGSGGGSGGAGEDRAAPVDRYASPFSPAEGPATPTRTGARIVEGRVYVNNGFWDTYRTTWPAYSLFTPDLAGEMADGFVRQYKDGGWISRWSSPGYADLMTGTSSDVAFADAFLKGVEFDAEAAYEAAVKNATVAPPDPGVGRKGLERSVFLGYTPTGTGDGMSWAIEGCLNDYGIARMAEELAGRTPDGRKRQRYRDESAYFLNRARNYVHLFDGRVGFFQGRDENGGWRLAPDAFDARTWGHDYTETNAWNMAFTVPQDGRGLANLYGGKPALAGKLDTFFSTPETGAPEFAGSYGGIIHEMSEARDVRMGMYGHSNQPSHHIAYMYDAAGQPWKTQKLVREALSRLYLGGEIGQGYLGDEDNGEMSAWYVFSALGFYPLVTGSPEYAVGSPLFTRATVHLPGGRDLVIEAPENSERNVYVQGLTVNGERWESTALPHSVLAGGGTIRFAMGPEPSAWGTGDDAAPTSVTRDDRVPDPLADAVPPGTAVTTGGGGGGGGAALADDTSGTAAQFTAAGIELDERTEAAFYTLTSSVRDKAPSSWVLKGSRDGTTWTVLDRRTDETFAWDRQTRVFGIGDPGAYTHYRLEPVGGPVSLAEIELLA